MTATDARQPAIADIGQIIQNGIAFNVNNWQQDSLDSMDIDTILPNVAQLFQLLESRQVDYVLVGGIAMRQYVEGRNTEDIDLIIGATSLDRLPEIELTQRDHNFAQGRFRQLTVDFLLTTNQLFDHVATTQMTHHHFLEQNVPCATVGGLLLLKLYALPSLYRQGNFARVGLYENDIAMLMQAYQPDMPMIWNELQPHLNQTDLAAVRDIVADVEARICRFQRGVGE